MLGGIRAFSNLCVKDKSKKQHIIHSAVLFCLLSEHKETYSMAAVEPHFKTLCDVLPSTLL